MLDVFLKRGPISSDYVFAEAFTPSGESWIHLMRQGVIFGEAEDAPLCRVGQHQITAQWAVMGDRENDKVLTAFGRNLRRARVSREITQEKLAELADLNPRTLQKIEAGKTNILITTAQRLQRGLRCPWEELLPEDDSASTARPTKE